MEGWMTPDKDDFFDTLSVCITEEDGTAEMTPLLHTLIFRVFML